MPNLVYNSPAQQAVLEAARQPYSPSDVYICVSNEYIPVTITYEGGRTYIKLRSSGVLGSESAELSEKMKYRPNAIRSLKKGERVTI